MSSSCIIYYILSINNPKIRDLHPYFKGEETEIQRLFLTANYHTKTVFFPPPWMMELSFCSSIIPVSAASNLPIS